MINYFTFSFRHVFSCFLQAKTAKGNLRLDSMNATIVPEKVGNPYGMQITFEQDGQTRNLFLYAEDGKVNNFEMILIIII